MPEKGGTAAVVSLAQLVGGTVVTTRRGLNHAPRVLRTTALLQRVPLILTTVLFVRGICFTFLCNAGTYNKTNTNEKIFKDTYECRFTAEKCVCLSVLTRTSFAW